MPSSGRSTDHASEQLTAEVSKKKTNRTSVRFMIRRRRRGILPGRSLRLSGLGTDKRGEEGGACVGQRDENAVAGTIGKVIILILSIKRHTPIPKGVTCRTRGRATLIQTVQVDVLSQHWPVENSTANTRPWIVHALDSEASQRISDGRVT